MVFGPILPAVMADGGVGGDRSTDPPTLFDTLWGSAADDDAGMFIEDGVVSLTLPVYEGEEVVDLEELDTALFEVHFSETWFDGSELGGDFLYEEVVEAGAFTREEETFILVVTRTEFVVQTDAGEVRMQTFMPILLCADLPEAIESAESLAAYRPPPPGSGEKERFREDAAPCMAIAPADVGDPLDPTPTRGGDFCLRKKQRCNSVAWNNFQAEAWTAAGVGIGLAATLAVGCCVLTGPIGAKLCIVGAVAAASAVTACYIESARYTMMATQTLCGDKYDDCCRDHPGVCGSVPD